MMLAAHSLNLGSIWIHRAKEEFELPEYQELLKELGVDGEWEGIGHCAVGYVDGEIPKAAKRKENRSGKGFGGSFGSLEAGRKNRDFLLPKV